VPTQSSALCDACRTHSGDLPPEDKEGSPPEKESAHQFEAAVEEEKEDEWHVSISSPFTRPELFLSKLDRRR
jgi:hypothetical protein